MSDHTWFIPLSGEVTNEINRHYAAALTTLMETVDLQGPEIFAAQVALSEAPKPVTPAVFLERTPYRTWRSVLEQLTTAVEKGILTATDDEMFSLTEQGKEIGRTVAAEAVKAGATVNVEVDSERIASLLFSLVDSCLAAEEPSHPCLNRSRFYDPGPAAPVIERLRRYLNDLNAFRDDVHMAAWQAYEVAGYEWEAFSHVHGDYVFGEPAANGEALAEKLGSFRGYDAQAYETALQKVTMCGWLTAADGRYRVTAEGKQVREAVEVETDRLFFAPWSLSAAEEAELKTLMEQLQQSLQEQAPS